VRAPGKRGRTRPGFTLLELTISVALMALILTTVLRVGQSVQDGSSTAAAAAQADVVVGRAIERLAEHLKGSGAGWFDVPTSSPLQPFCDVEYERVVAYEGGLVDTEVERIYLERSPVDPNDGIDNDGNGVIDDGRVVLIRAPGTPEELRSIVCDRVPESLGGEVDGNLLDDNGNGLVDEQGLALDFVDGGVRVRLTVVERDRARRSVERTAERMVWFRNETASWKLPAPPVE
jgi:prepilin-type N-terminal cleavage/methylation domain-containing protein